MLQCQTAPLVRQDHELIVFAFAVGNVRDVSSADRRVLQQLGHIVTRLGIRPVIGGQQIGLEERRTNHADLDAQRVQLGQQALRQRDNSGLGHVVVAHARRLDMGSHGSDVDDAACPLAHEQRHERLAALDHAHQVDAYLGVPVFQRQVPEQAA